MGIAWQSLNFVTLLGNFLVRFEELCVIYDQSCNLLRGLFC